MARESKDVGKGDEERRGMRAEVMRGAGDRGMWNGVLRGAGESGMARESGLRMG